MKKGYGIFLPTLLPTLYNGSMISFYFFILLLLLLLLLLLYHFQDRLYLEQQQRSSYTLTPLTPADYVYRQSAKYRSENSDSQITLPVPKNNIKETSKAVIQPSNHNKNYHFREKKL